MPFVVTATRPAEEPGERVLDLVSRLAVVTLGEAVFEVAREGSGVGEDDPGFAEFKALVRQLVSDYSGGTIGPLPDGTVVKVRQVDTAVLAREAGRPLHDYDWTTAEVVRAWNAKHRKPS
jgi:hypothetical protein